MKGRAILLLLLLFILEKKKTPSRGFFLFAIDLEFSVLCAFVELVEGKMGIRFILMVNKQGQTRLAQYYEYLTLEERRALEGEIVRKCLARNEQQVSLLPLPIVPGSRSYAFEFPFHVVNR